MLAGRRCLLTYTLGTETAPLVRDRGEAVLLLRAKLLFDAAKNAAAERGLSDRLDGLDNPGTRRHVASLAAMKKPAVPRALEIP